jgi:hypothetical protein
LRAWPVFLRQHRELAVLLLSLDSINLIAFCSDDASSSIRHILPNILSEDKLLRSATLDLLEKLAPHPIVAVAREAEAVPLAVHSARERNMHVRKLGITAKSLSSDSTELEIAIRYLIGTVFHSSSENENLC